ncbi:hypothetical protein FBU30_007873 [Linnemannia zychae]|nr:hypothetical protein FBU30_007873 [Linnemannia zychae]
MLRIFTRHAKSRQQYHVSLFTKHSSQPKLSLVIPQLVHSPNNAATLAAPLNHHLYQQRLWFSTTLQYLRQYEKHLDHINIHKKPPPPSDTHPPHTTIPSSTPHCGAAASVVDQDLDDHYVQHAVDTLDLDTDEELKKRHQTHDTAAILNKDELGIVEEEDVTVTSTPTNSVLLEDKNRSDEEFSWFVDTAYTTTNGTNGQDSSRTDVDKGSAQSQDYVPLWKRNARAHHPHQKHSKHSKPAEVAARDQLLQSAPIVVRGLVRVLEHERAKNVAVMDMRQKCDWTDWMIIAEGLSERHVGNIADQVYSSLKKVLSKTSPPIMEGRSTPDWIVIDTGSIILHFMTHDSRKEHNLEGLWNAVKDPLKTKNPDEIAWEDLQEKLVQSWNEDPGRAKGAEHGTKRGRRGDQDLSVDEVVKG